MKIENKDKSPVSRKRRLVTVLSVLLGMCFGEALARERPNIVLIMADDMGFSDLGCFGGEIGTPTLDRLAAGGLRFTQFYNTGRCCPTRASILTGLYPHQAGMGWMTTDRGHDGYRGDLNNRCATIAEVLKSSGYAAYAVGKWHVTKHTNPDGPKHNWPLQRGFDRFYGTITGAGSFYDPGTLTRDNTMISPFSDTEYQPDQYYYTHAITDHAVRFLSEHDGRVSRDQPAPDDDVQEAHADKPFFLYVAYTAAHWPMHALERDIAKYRGRYDQGYTRIRASRFARAKELGLIDDEWELSPQAGDWEAVEHREWEARCMEVYAAMIDSMDQGIGRIVGELSRQGKLENTLILFLQDNGGCQETVGRQGDRRRPVEPSLPAIAANSIRTDVIPKQNRRGVPTLMGPNIMPGPEDTYIAYGLNWANVSNTPFREYKHFVHEGGISTPLIAHWPQRIKRQGELVHEPGHLIDIMATCIDVAGAKYPPPSADQPADGESAGKANTDSDGASPDSGGNGGRLTPIEGTSLVPAFEGREIGRTSPIFWEHEGNRAVRDRQWKLVAKENGPWELYDMERDRTELHDLSSRDPDRVKSLAEKWNTWAERANVLPIGAWRGMNAPTSFNKTKRRFELTAGDDLPRESAPFVTGRGLFLKADILATADNGVILAHGGSEHGYTLFMRGGTLTFAVCVNGKRTVLPCEKPLPGSSCSVVLRMDAEGRTTIEADGCPLLAADTPGPMQEMPVDGLQVGRDEGGAVGDYETPFPFEGRIGRVVLELK